MKTKNVPISGSFIGAMFARMLADKKAISSYIQENGTLDGFNDDSIRFAQPL